jgi:toxin ParE1/3/4
MTLPVLIRPEALVDIRTSQSRYESAQKGLGNVFVDLVVEILERIGDTPFLYGVVWQDVRAARTRKFPYLVYYVVLIDRIEVMAVLHASQDEPVWQHRQ